MEIRIGQSNVTAVATLCDIQGLQDMMLASNECFAGEDLPLNHQWADGVYSRELFLPQGTTIVTKMHRKDNFLVLMKGTIEVWYVGGRAIYHGPRMLKTTAGTKRVIRAVSSATLITFHAVVGESVEECEDEIIVPVVEEQHFLQRQEQLALDFDEAVKLTQGRSSPK
jgi:hypothetical protein